MAKEPTIAKQEAIWPPQHHLVPGSVDAKLGPKATASETMRIAPARSDPKQ